MDELLASGGYDESICNYRITAVNAMASTVPVTTLPFPLLLLADIKIPPAHDVCTSYLSEGIFMLCSIKLYA